MEGSIWELAYFLLKDSKNFKILNCSKKSSLLIFKKGGDGVRINIMKATGNV